MRYLLLLSIVSITLSSSLLNAEEVKEISITSSQSAGFGRNYQEVYLITKKGDQFFSGSRAVDKLSIDFLLRAVRQPTLLKLDMGNLEIGKSWVNRNEEIFLSGLSRTQAKQLKVELQKPGTIEKSVLAYFKSVWSEDVAKLEVVITLSSGTIVLRSESQKAFMLPWVVQVGNAKRTTWDAGIARALADIMEAGALNRQRLTGVGLAKQLKFPRTKKVTE